MVILRFYISTIDWDFGLKQKATSMAWFFIFSKWILITKFLVFSYDLRMKIQSFVCKFCTDIKYKAMVYFLTA